MTDRRYYVLMKSGRKFCVEEFGETYTSWGNVDPASKKLEKVTSKSSQVIDETNTEITTENGYKNICFLTPGTSAIAYIEALDKSGVERFEGADFVKYVD